MSWCLSLLALLFHIVAVSGNNESECSQKLYHFEQEVRGRLSRLEDDNELLHEMNREQDKLIKIQMEKIKQLESELKKRSNSVTVAVDERPPMTFDEHVTYLSEHDALQSSDDNIMQGFNHPPHSFKSRSIKKRQIPSGISFYAYISQNMNGLSPNKGIIFDTVVNNEADGYQNASGVFIVPETGIYVFMWSLTARTGNIPMQLTVNGLPRNWLDPYTGSHDGANTASGFIVLRVNSGDQVLIRTHPTFHPKGYIESDHWIQSGFGGWVLQYE